MTRIPTPSQFHDLHHRAMAGDSGALDNQNDLILSRVYQPGRPAYIIGDRVTQNYVRASKSAVEDEAQCYAIVVSMLRALAAKQTMYGKLPGGAS